MMESINLEMEDLFDQEAGDDEDVGAQALLPELEGDEDGPMRTEDAENEQDDEEGVVANLQRLSKGAAKKRVTRPQPKLDVERLKSERGLAVLPSIFQDVKFKGKGFEAQDLKLMMSKLEHWAHRLYPNSTFNQFIERMEKLGTKKPVQTCLKRVRLDMPLLDSDYVAQYDEPQASPENERIAEEEMEEVDAEEAFEKMMRQEREKQKQMTSEVTGDALSSQTGQSPEMKSQNRESILIGDMLSTPDKTNTLTPSTPETQRDNKQEMTPDIKGRIEANRRKALEKRAAKLGVPVESLLPPKKGNKSSKTLKMNESQDMDQAEGSLSSTIADSTLENTDTISQSAAGSQSDCQLEAGTPSTSQLQPCSHSQQSNQSQIDSLKNSNTYSPGKGRDKLEEDMQTEEALMDILESDDDGDALIRKDGPSCTVDDENLNLEPINTSPADQLTDVKNSVVVDLNEEDGLNLHLDMSVSEAVDHEDGDCLNLQLDLSVNENS